MLIFAWFTEKNVFVPRKIPFLTVTFENLFCRCYGICLVSRSVARVDGKVWRGVRETARGRVEHFEIFENLFFAITLNLSRILTEHIYSIRSLES